MCKAIDIAKWFVKNGYEAPNSFDGNMKINKLLYFAQLISLIKRNKALFNDKLYAFEHGVVIENIRKEYYCNYNNFINEANKFNDNFLVDEKEILELTKNIFGDSSADELSKLTHEHNCWKDYYKKSKSFDGWYLKEESIIEIDNIINNYQEDLNLIKTILLAYEESNNDIEEKYIMVDNTKFYYDPSEFKMTDSVMEAIENFQGEDDAYSLYIDKSQGLVIY